MGRPVVLTKVLTAASTNAVAAAQTLLAAGNLTLTASPVSLDTQRRVLFTFAADETGHTFSVYGTNSTGAAIREDVAGTAAGTVATAFDFATVNRIAVNAATTGNVTVGTNTVGSSRWSLFDAHVTPPWLGLDLELTGTGNATVEVTYDPVLLDGVRAGINYIDAMTAPVAAGVTGLTSKAASAQGSVGVPVSAWRLTVNSGTGSWKLTGIQAGLAGP